MKKILVPTDFSPCAEYATDAAIDLAQKLEAEVHLYSRIAMHPFWHELTEQEKMDFPESFAELYDLKRRFSQLKEKYEYAGVSLKTSYSAGNMLSVVGNYIDDHQIDMLLMGSHGSSGFGELIFGSNAQKMVRHAHCPTMILKRPLVNPDFKQVVFASDFREEAEEPFRRLLALIRPFSCHLHLLSVKPYPQFKESPSVTAGNRTRFLHLAAEINCTEHSIEGLNVELGISEFARDINADLVALAHYGRSPLQRIFTGSVTEALVNHLDIPVLSLNPKVLRESWQGDASNVDMQSKLSPGF